MADADDSATSGHVGGTFGTVSRANQNLSVSLTANNVNISTSGLAALERLAQHSPEVAASVVRATEAEIKSDSRKYIAGAICAAVVATAMILTFALIVIVKGILEGFLFFFICAAVSAVISAIFTGKMESLSWTAGPLGRFISNRKADDD